MHSEEWLQQRRATSRRFYEKHKERIRAEARAKYQADPEAARARARIYTAGDPEAAADRKRRYAEKYPERVKAAQKLWHAQHPEYLRTYYLRNRRYQMLKGSQRRALKAGVPFTLTLDDIVIPEICPVLGIKIAHGCDEKGRGFKDTSPSVDRIIPEHGYVLGNIRVISWRANKIKSDATADELIRVANYVVRETANRKTG